MNNLIKKDVRLKKPAGYGLILLVFLFLGAFLLREVCNYDIWFHLRAGKWIIENLRAPEHIDYSVSNRIGYIYIRKHHGFLSKRAYP